MALRIARFTTGVVRWLVRGIGVLVVVWFAGRADWGRIATRVAGVSPAHLIGLAALSGFGMLLRAQRWRLLLRAQHVDLARWKAWSIYAVGLFLGSLTPGRVGDLARGAYVREESGAPWSTALASVAADRLLDAVVMVALGLWGFHHFGLLPGTWPAIVAAAAAATFGVLMLSRAAGRRRLAAWASASTRPLISNAAMLLSRTMDAMALAFPWGWLWGLVLTVAADAVYVYQTVSLLQALQLAVSWPSMVAAVVLVAWASSLPVSIAGLGPREAALALLLARCSVPHSTEAALSYSALFLVSCYLPPVVVGGVYWLKAPLPIRASMRDAQAAGETDMALTTCTM